MMHKEPSANGNVHHQVGKRRSPDPSNSQNRQSREMNGVISNQKKNIPLQSANESDDSTDSSPTIDIPTAADTTAFSRSLSGLTPSNSLNVYSMSPRNTSVMYQYYSTPRSFFQNQTPLIHSQSRSNGQCCTEEHTGSRQRHYSFGRPPSDCYESPPKSPLSGIPRAFQNEISEDPRRRAWSESDSNKKNNMHLSRMSALKKLRKKLGRSSSLKKKKDDISHNGCFDQAGAGMNSLEKVEEGRQLRWSQNASPSLSKRSTMTEEIADLSTLSLHQEDETTRLNELSPDYRANERERVPSSESVFSSDTELIYQRFLEEHTCYDVMPTSCKLVVFDTRLQARKAFHALVENSVRSAPLWDSQICCYVGMLTVTDFIKVILKAHRTPNMRVESVEERTIESWRNLLDQQCSFANVHPEDTLLDSLKVLINENFHGVPIMDEGNGDIYHIINHKRILRFLHLFMKELPKPSFMYKTLRDVNIGTYDQVSTVTKNDTMLATLEQLIDKKLTAIPVLDENGDVVDVFCKLDMIPLAAQGLYHDLSMTMEIALAFRFTPIFEEEECPADAFSRFSSPRPQRRDITPKGKFSSRNHAPSPMSNLMHDNKNKSESSSTKIGQAAIKGHGAVRSRSQRSQEVAERSHRSKSVTQPPVLTDSLVPECPGHRVRHKSMRNPLIKCRLSDTLQRVIDLMVTTEANLLVVVGQANNHVIGVVTVADVLYYIVNPPGYSMKRDSPPRIHKRASGNQCSSTSAPMSPPSAPNEVESALDGDTSALGTEVDGRNLAKQSSSHSSTRSSNDSGYSISAVAAKKKDLDPFDAGANFVHNAYRRRAYSNRSEREYINSRFRRKGVEMERF